MSQLIRPVERFLNKHSKVIFRILGIIGLIVSVYLLVGGVTCLWANSTTEDSEGFFSSWKIQINRDSHAIVFGPDSVHFGDISDLPNIKIKASNNNLSSQIFIGITTEANIDAYLGGVEYDEITDLRIYPCRAIYFNHPGSTVPASPASQAFWTLSTQGTGIQELTWERGYGRDSLVLMNEDGSAGMDIDLVVGTKEALLFTTGLANLAIGIFGLLLSLLILFITGKSRSVVYPKPL